MKRIEKDISVEMPPVRLYFDELQQLVDAASVGGTISLRHGDFVYDSLAELKQHVSVDSLQDLYVHVRVRDEEWSNLHIKIDRDAASVRGDGALKERTAACALALAEKSPWYSWYPVRSPGGWNSAVFLLALTALGVWYWYCFYLTPEWGVGISTAAYWLLQLPVFVLMFSKNDTFIGISRIYLHTRNSKLSFWQRNKDDILKDVVKLVVGAVLGYVLARLTGSVPHS